MFKPRTILSILFAVVFCGIALVGAQPNTSTTSVGNGSQTSSTPIQSALSNSQLAEIKKIMADPIWKDAKVSVLVKNNRTGKTLFSNMPDQFCMPASTNKLVTGAAALSILGPRYHFVTKVQADDRPDENGVIKGNLYIIGGGDPHLTMDEVWNLAHGIYIAGVRKVTGDLVGDDSFHDQVRFYDDWGRQTGRAYHAALGGLSVNFNTVACWIRPGAKVGDPARVTIEPALPNMQITGKIETVEGAGNRCGLSLRGNQAVVSGTIGLHARPNPTYQAVPNPLDYSMAAIREALKKEGIAIVGKTRQGVAPQSSKFIHKHESEQLSLILRQLFRFSNNFTAEQILRTIGAVKYGAPGSREKGARAITEWMQQNNLYRPGVVIYDGSGLSRQNRQSAESMVGILDYMGHRPDLLPEYLEAQPIAGVDGTLRYRFKRTSLIGRVRAKTGLINGVISLAGYSFDARGEMYSFAALVNDFKPTAGVRGPQMLTERLLDVLMQ